MRQWEKGRQGTGYRKLLLARGHRWDAWLLDYPVGVEVPEHTDGVSEGRHWRLNIRLFGEDTFAGRAVFRRGRFVLFRPDVMPHAVKPVKRRRMVLSFGFVEGAP